MINKCPGQDTQFWKPNDIYNVDCPQCGKSVEFFKDDISRRCEKCGHTLFNPKLNLGCARWCQFAEQCVGAIGKDEFKEILTLAMKEYYGDDKGRIDKALKVLRTAEDILERENGNAKVVIAASILYDIGVHDLEKNFETDKESDQEKYNLPSVQNILERSGSKKKLIDEVCHIIGNHRHPEKFNTSNANIVYDAIHIVNFKDEKTFENTKRLKRIINQGFFTATGKEIAKQAYLYATRSTKN